MIRFLIALVALTAPLSLAAQTPAAPAPAAPPAPVRVEILTDQGRMVIEVDREHAPISAGNFLHYVDQKRLDGATFYRTVKPGPNFGFIQFGVQNAPARVLPPVAHEPTTLTGIKHTNGVISTARSTPGSARGDFTIMVGNQPSLDADPTKPGDNLGYAAFGNVVEGMETVLKIQDLPPSPTGYFKNESLAEPVKIISARRIKVVPGA